MIFLGKKNGHDRIVLGILLGFSVGALNIIRLKNNRLKDVNKKEDKYRLYYKVLNKWLKIKNDGKSLSLYFSNNNINKIAIYGMGELGNRLYEELKNNEDILVIGGIDKDVDKTAEIKIYSLDETLPEIDAIIVTAIFEFDEIKNKLERVTNASILSIEDIVFRI